MEWQIPMEKTFFKKNKKSCSKVTLLLRPVCYTVGNK